MQTQGLGLLKGAVRLRGDRAGAGGQPGSTELQQSHAWRQSAMYKAASPPSGQEGNEPALVLTTGTNGIRGTALDTAQEML